MHTITIKSDQRMVTISLDEYETMKETIALLTDKALRRQIRRAIKEHKEGRSQDLDEFWLRNPDEN